MALKFEISGPVFKYDEETEITFKRTSQNQIFQWEQKNSVLTNRNPAELKEFADRAKKGISNWDFYTGEEKALLAQLGSRFCCDFVDNVSLIKDESGGSLNYQDFTDEQKFRFWDQLQEETRFSDWLEKFKLGGEKKSDPVVENN